MPVGEGWKKQHQRIMSLIVQGNLTDAQGLSLGEGRVAFNAAKELLGRLIRLNLRLAEADGAQGMAVTAAAEKMLLAMALLGVLLAVGDSPLRGGSAALLLAAVSGRGRALPRPARGGGRELALGEPWEGEADFERF